MGTLRTQKRRKVKPPGIESPSLPTRLSAYRLMWMLATFDLPVETKMQRKAATRFRNFLLDQGFEMSQFSNYMRFCNGREQFDTYARRIEANLPDRGHVFLFQFTDRQYESIIRFSDQSRRTRQKNPGQLALF
ncbi:CRISPR-associated endonuclease Cas2 [Aurantimonas sp. C2-6-R+9]|uniref:CRISPR-associated endonuclease Cas2 n=1 Tax=unclassified Aurantimonas TaxID=2638230 RepID=UPI002E1915AE|nr:MULTISPECIES: CRISPR-associated endonuclease Cas2 [unclassified Aurantimonas]MEC5291605.1 CRISPR-associated endonuclease Cas2 [Aurantimonas sp. C2-3-R2]MEC5384019.1 CRISPR-associated endonuclease Cas2 [Aurantimonas sp. C2-6-R+9]MEC5412689.1 CRISPR-associated endonuclease Cas2 [Aurantimonas sp. C2-4-R8]